MTEYATLAEALAHARVKKDINQSEAARIIKVPSQTYNSWETRGCRPQTEHIEGLAKFLGFSVIDTLRLAGLGQPFKGRAKAKPAVRS